MQGISKGKHIHLTDALHQLEDLLKNRPQEAECLEQATAYRQELEMMHANYEQLLEKLAEQIAEYEDLFGHVKVQVLGKKLKELKKDIPADRTTAVSALAMLHHNIQLAYGT